MPTRGFSRTAQPFSLNSFPGHTHCRHSHCHQAGINYFHFTAEETEALQLGNFPNISQLANNRSQDLSLGVSDATAPAVSVTSASGLRST